MIALMDLANYTISMSFLLDELLQRKSDRLLAGDNVAALAIYGGTAMHWRTKHLRIRARAFHERYQEGQLPAVHVPGEWNPADLGTKALPAARHWKLCNLVGLSAPKEEASRPKGSRGPNASVEQCLKAVVLACCLCTTKGQPTSTMTDNASDRILAVLLALLVIAAIALWEVGRFVVRSLGAYCRPRPVEAPPPPPPVLADTAPDEQPDAEDDLQDMPGLQPLVPEEDRAHREEREREQAVRAEEAEVAQAEYEAGLRRQGARVYGPEPDVEPVPRPPEHPPPQEQGPIEHPPDPDAPVLRYVDDRAFVDVTEEPRGVVQRPLEPYAFGNPRPAHEGEEQGQPRPQARLAVRSRAEVLGVIAREEAEARRLDLPPNPPLVINPNWGPPEDQPPLRYLLENRNNWGDLRSALHQFPPTHERRDMYQLDEARGVLIRWHVQARIRLFTPEGSRLPVPLEQRGLTGRRRSLIITLTRRYWIEDNYHDPRPQRNQDAEWRGRTELEINRAYLQQIQAEARAGLRL